MTTCINMAHIPDGLLCLGELKPVLSKSSHIQITLIVLYQMQFLWCYLYYPEISGRVQKYDSKTCAIMHIFIITLLTSVIDLLFCVPFSNNLLFFKLMPRVTNRNTCICINKQFRPDVQIPYQRRKINNVTSADLDYQW